MKLLILLSLIISLSCFAATQQSKPLYGLGKVLEYKNTETDKKEYFLLVKVEKQSGLIPIKSKSVTEIRNLAKLKNGFVVFKGNIRTISVKKGEITTNREFIEFSEVKELSLNSLALKNDDIDIHKKESVFSPIPGPTRTEFSLNDEATGVALATSAAMILSAGVDAGNSNNIRQQITQGLVLTSGMIILASKLKDAFKVQYSQWRLNSKRASD